MIDKPTEVPPFSVRLADAWDAQVCFPPKGGFNRRAGFFALKKIGFFEFTKPGFCG
jgi:hypothetical protein